MPAKSRWMLDIPRIIAELEVVTTPIVDRAVCERLFQVRRRQAINLIEGFGGYRSGNAILIDRSSLINTLQAMETDPRIAIERRRKQRLAEEVGKVARFRKAAHIRIPVAADVHRLTLPSLPASVQLSPGRLTIQFDGVEQLLTHVYELSQVAVNDFERFRLAAEDPANR